MAKRANIRLFWKKSVSVDADRVQLKHTIDGTETIVDLPAATEEFQIQVFANKTFSYVIDTYDSEGTVATSQRFTMTLGDLEDVQPATNLDAEIVSVDDVPDEEVPPSARRTKRPK